MDPTFILKLLFYLVFSSCFFLQVWDQMEKFFNKETILVFGTNLEDNLTFPSLAICPENGFHSDIMTTKLGINENYWAYLFSSKEPQFNWTIPENKTAYDLWWNQSIYGLEEVIQEVYMYDGKTGNMTAAYEENHIAHTEQVRLEQVASTAYGSCAILHSRKRVETLSDYVNVNLINRDGLLRIFSFEEGLETFGITFDFWLAPFESFTVVGREIVNLGFVKKVETLNPDLSSCSVSGTMVDYVGCLLKHTYGTLGSDANCTICYLPQYRQWTKDRPMCKSLSQARCTTKAIKSSWVLANGNGVCAMPCSREEYVADYRSKPNPLAELYETRMFVYYNHLEVVSSREYVLYDFNTIVANVGGSLGLFLGFSFLDFALKSVVYIKRGFAALKKVERKKIVSFAD